MLLWLLLLLLLLSYQNAYFGDAFLSTVRNPQFKFMGPGCNEQLLAWLLGPRPPENWRHSYSRGTVITVAAGVSALGWPKGVLAYLKDN